MASPQPVEPMTDCANRIYYFEVGLGDWVGFFTFKLTDWAKFRQDPIGLKNRFLVLAMAVVSKLLGRSKITSRLEGHPQEGKAGVVENLVRITKFGLPVYRLHERYILDPDCVQVWVKSKERFGPIPFLFNVEKEHPAEIGEGGMSSTYFMPLLGTEWIGRYTVREDRNHIDARLECPWAISEEVIDRVQP